MNKAAKKSVGRSKSVKKASARSTVSAAVKPVKKRLTARSVSSKAVAAKPASDDFKPTVVPLAEVASLAAKAINMITAKRSLPPAEKAVRLALVAEKLERASGWGGISASGAWGLVHPFGIGKIIDMRAVMR